MLNLFTKGITKLFGTKSDRDNKELFPYIGLVNSEFERLKGIDNDGLRAETDKLRATIADRLSSIDSRISELEDKAENDESLDINDKEAIFAEVDKLEEQRNKELEDILLELLPTAFAIVKSTAVLFKENERIEVTASMSDRNFAAVKEHVELNGEKAIWHNNWLAAGNRVTWDMVHYDVQIIGGVVLHQGKIAEMATGEGKTLVATLPAFLNALAGRGVHIVTVNNYLAARDSEWMAPIFEFHGLRVDCIDKHQPNSDARRNAYAADITYGTNNEFGFDYLRDNMARSTSDLVQRKHHYAMVDEVDSVLIDDARTPLIISGPIPKGDEHEFYELKPAVVKLVEAQKKVVQDFLIDAKKKIKEGDEKAGGLSLFRAFRGLPKSKPLIKFLGEQGMRAILQKTENYYLQDNSKAMPEADEPLFFTIEEKNNNIDLTERGVDLITGEGTDSNFFIMPDMATEIGEIENSTDLSDKEKAERKDKLISDYTTKSERIHTINQLLKAYTLFEKDDEYILVDGKVKIVDEQTGRVMEGRRYSDGLHQAIEAKENVKVEDATQTYATVTLQNYFRMYHKLAGMTGTAETEAGEFWDIYKLDVVVIPTNKPIVRDDRQDKVYKTVREKFNAVAEEIVELTQQGRPVLVGTTSVEISELVSRMLKIRNIKHQVLNAKQHAREADVVAEAGKPGTVTIATNMAGRGTDIKLSPESKAAGGLAIIGTERHESRRVDRQLRGRAGRQGDVGSSQFFVSLDDNLMRLFGSDRIAKLMDRLGLEEGEVIQHSMITKSIERAQKKVEENNFSMRKRLLEYDDVMNSQREVIYKRRRNALFGDRLEVDILNMLYDSSEDIVNGAKAADNYSDFKLSTISTLGFDPEVSEEEFSKMAPVNLIDKLYLLSLEHYRTKAKETGRSIHPLILQINQERGATVTEIGVPFTDGRRQVMVSADLKKAVANESKEIVKGLEKFATLSFIDQDWKEHLREMDDLKQAVQSASYEQKDPLLIYKFEAFELFKRFISKLNENTISFLAKAHIPLQNPDQLKEAEQPRRGQGRLSEQKDEAGSLLQPSGAGQNREPAPKPQPMKSEKIHGRNDKVTVRYMDGSTKTGVKFKQVEDDIRHSRCVVIED